MHMAHIYARQLGSNKKFALLYAWHMEHIRKSMQNGIVRFVFIKLSGEIRMAKGTLHPLLIPEDKRPKGTATGEPNYSTIAFFDLDKQDWRSFRILDFQYAEDIYLLTEVPVLKERG